MFDQEQLEIAISPGHVTEEGIIEEKIRGKLNGYQGPLFFKLKRKSIDARSRRVVFRLLMKISKVPFEDEQAAISESWKSVENKEEVLIVGAGPAGYFAALQCISLGLKPIVLERGKDVRARRKDLRAIQQFGEVNPNSNYCFGEGGAGTYSDGKLYTRSYKRGSIENILRSLVDHGANENILTDAHPHIGSNKLPKIIANIRETIERFGGEIHFETKVVDINFDNNQFESLLLESGKVMNGKVLILATGHSARDIFKILNDKNVQLEAKDFALGVRIEHPQEFIDELQYKHSPRHENLPASSYKFAVQIEDKGVFSFCNCPGGLIVPAATTPGEIVVNGMSLSKRDSPFSNSGFVTEIKIEELEQHGYSGPFAAVEFQKKVEQDLFNHGDGSQKAPGQLVKDFIEGKTSKELYESSYIPGVYSAPLHKLLPEFVVQRLQEGLKSVEKKMKGFTTGSAQIVGTESRTSSPIRIPRDPSTRMHPDIKGFFPCGEGAGYAGGILSAAMDGQNVANSVSEYISN